MRKMEESDLSFTPVIAILWTKSLSMPNKNKVKMQAKKKNSKKRRISSLKSTIESVKSKS